MLEYCCDVLFNMPSERCLNFKSRQALERAAFVGSPFMLSIYIWIWDESVSFRNGDLSGQLLD